MTRTVSIPEWSLFEENVKTALEAIGYVVKRNVSLASSQIDLYAEKKHPLGTHRYVIECKSSVQPVGIEAIRGFFGLVEHLSTKKQPIAGLFVSEKGYTKDAKAFGLNAGLQLTTLEDLFDLSFDPRLLIRVAKELYENDTLSRIYVDLSCQVTEMGRSTVYKPVETFLDEFLAHTKRPGVAVLGNFGCGKTSFCKHYSCVLACRWAARTSVPLPLYVNLRDIHNFENIADSFRQYISSMSHTHISAEGWRYWIENRNMILILDGFDEMASQMDKVQIQKNLSTLLNFVNLHPMKVILTCRTHFFRTQVEEETLGNMLRLYIRDWGEHELESYVSKTLPDSREKSLSLIKGRYNLPELAKTPIFLSIIVSTIEKLGGHVNQAKLYQFYTDRWIQSQDYRSHLSPVEKTKFMEELAFEIFLTGESRISHEALPERIRTFFEIKDYTSVKAIDLDIRTCTFLVRDESGYFYFVHRSFAEFFVGLKLAKEVKEGIIDNFAARVLPFEIAGFTANFFETDSAVLLKHLLGHASSNVKANSAFILGFIPLTSENLAGLKLALSIDADINVKRKCADALAMSKHADAIAELVILAQENDGLSVYCLKLLDDFVEHQNVRSVLKSIVESNNNEEKVCVALDIIGSRACVELLDTVKVFAKASVWEKSDEITRSLLRAIQAIADLDLALTIKNLRPVSSDSERLFEQVVHYLKQRLFVEVEELARANRVSGMSYQATEGKLYSYLGVLADSEQIRKALSRAYRGLIEGNGDEEANTERPKIKAQRAKKGGGRRRRKDSGDGIA
jgi:hypothetical protein